METTKDSYDRRAKPVATTPKEACGKLDTFANISTSLIRIESKVDNLSDEMRVMIKLEQQVLTQSKDIDRINGTTEELKKDVSQLRSSFEMQKQSISNFERIVWAGATVIAVLIGKYMFGIG